MSSMNPGHPSSKTSQLSLASGGQVSATNLRTLAREIAHDGHLRRMIANTIEVESSSSKMGAGKEPDTRGISEQPSFYYAYTNNDQGYNTYNSQISRDSTENLLCPPFPGGIIRFLLEGGEDLKDRYYVTVNKDANMEDIARFMATAWRRRTPKLVLTIINTARYYQPSTKEKFIEDFQEGIIKAANLTEMWILTEGLDIGISKLIGDAAYTEMTRRKNLEQNPLHIKNIDYHRRLPRLNIMGIVSKSAIIYADVLNGMHIQAYSVQNAGGKPALQLYDLNPDHTHFILVEDDIIPDQEALSNFRFNLEMRFVKPVGKPRHYRPFPSSFSTLLVSSSDPAMHQMEHEHISTPLIGLMIQGGPPDIEHTLGLLKKKIPVVVVCGSGLAADLVAFAYHEMQERSDSDYLDNYVKPELMRRVSEAFPDDFANNDIARNQCRDRIIECVKLAKQEDLTFLTIINTERHEVRLNDLSKYLLMALFQSQARRKGRHWREQVQWDIQLTLDWNRPDLARTEIFNSYNLTRFRIEDHLFHQALLLSNREAFIDLFLEHRMQVHLYLNHKRLHHLFENAPDKDFFVGVCLEGALGKTVLPHAPICSNFVEDVNCELNRLLYKCTGLQKLVNPYELSMNSLGSYVTDRAVAERRAMNTLVFWAALTNRHELAKVLWKRTEDPMAMALIVSRLLHQLGSKWCKDLDMRQKVKKSATEFSKMAVKLLMLSYQESSTFAFTALSKRLDDFNNRTVVELAKLGENKFFIAHPCCQKWLAQRWHGNIHIRELDWGPMKLPDWFKICMSVFLVFPMFMWITFIPTENTNKDITADDDEEGLEEAAEKTMLLRVTSMEDKLHNTGKSRRPKRRNAVKVTFQNMMDRTGSLTLPIWKQLYYLWSAPVTKFWINQLFYIFFLIAFSFSLLLPYCGDPVLDIAVFIWTLTIWMELVRRTLVKKRMYPELNVKWLMAEIIAILLFILIFLGFRIVQHFVKYVDFMTTKFFISLGLLFFYYRTLAVFVPVSPTLGPMLVSIIAMVKKDFYDWMRLFLMVLVSGAITIQAVIYPSFPLGKISLRQAFSRAIFGLFLTKIDDLDGSPTCSHLYQNKDVQYCEAEKVLSDNQLELLETCPHESLANYVLVIQYLFIVKLIFTTLLYAMFSVTTGKVYNESIEIWKYQRYGMIIDFEERLILPPPLTILIYVYYILKKIGEFIFFIIFKCCRQSPCCHPPTDQPDPVKIQIMKFRRASDYNYWKNCISKFCEEEENERKEQNRAKFQSDCLKQLLEEVHQHRHLSRHLNDRIVQLESNFTNSCLLLEEMKHMIERLNPKTQQLPVEPKKLLHVAARQSPYPGTRVRRFPVFDKFVPWEVPFDTYDPDVYTRPVSEFQDEIKLFVDPDVLQSPPEMDARQLSTSAEESEILLPSNFHPLYNAVATITIDSVEFEVDRTSWITTDNQPLRYKLDASDVPQNPLGRTGIRGRGKLWRWGPNHRISAVVTRWRRKYSPLGFPMDHILVDGKRVLEFIVVVRSDTGELTLPGGNVYGKASAYSVMCDEFLLSVFNEENLEENHKRTQDDMRNFFAQFARSSGATAGTYKEARVDMAACGFSASVLYRGYIDDPTNTDNAWREAEVWNFHYGLYDMFDEKIKEREKVWKEVTPYMRLYGNQDSIVMEAARIHGASC